MKKSSVRTGLIVILIALSTIITLQTSVKAQGEPNIYVSNQFPTGSNNFIFYTNTTSVGFKFNATVNTNNGTDIFAWQVKMYYNNATLNATRAWLPSGTDSDYILFGQPTIRPTPSFGSNYVQIGDSSLGSNVTFATPKKMAIIEFEILATPPSGPGSKLNSVLNITNVDTYLLNFNLDTKAITTTDGLYELNYVPPATQISLSASPASLNYGGSVRLSGVIATVPPNASLAFSNVPVTVVHRVGTSGSFAFVITVNTNSTSGYSYNWQTTGKAAGVHEFQTSWSGNATYSGATSSIVSITITIPAGSPTISVINPMSGTQNFIFYNSTTPVGYRFNTTMNVDKGTLVASWQVMMNYNATYLNATRAWVQSTDVQYIFRGLFTVLPPPAFYPGSVKIGDTLVGTDNVNFTTPKKLAIIEFEVMAEPPTGGKVSSTLDINNPGDTVLLDVNTIEIPTFKTSGLYELRSGSKPSSQITISASPTNVIGGASVRINGTVATAPNVLVTIWHKISTGAFTNLTTVTTNSSSIYTYSWTSAVAETHQFKANWTGNDNYLGAESTTVSVTVNKASSTITLTTSTTSAKVGDTVTLGGIVGPSRPNANVNLTSGTTPLGTVTTDANGAYTFDWKPTAEGTYTITASWLGDNTYNGATSTTVTVTVTPAPPPTDYTIYYIIAAVVIIVIILILLYWYMRRRRQSEQK